MRKLILALSIALSFAAVAVLHGQEQAPKTDPKPGDPVTVTGCFERAVRDMPAGTSGTDPSIVRADTKWVLTAPSKLGSDEAVGTSSARPKVEYRLEIGDESNYAAHEGHKVQITGTLEEGPPAEAGQTDTKHSSGRAPLLKVQSVKMISENCSK